MSNRKTDEIKFRVTPDEKHSWQAVAAEEDTSLSELIRTTMNQRAQQAHFPTEPQGNAFDTATVTLNGEEVVPIVAAPQPDRVGTSGEVGANRREADCPCGKPSYVYCGVCRG